MAVSRKLFACGTLSLVGEGKSKFFKWGLNCAIITPIAIIGDCGFSVIVFSGSFEKECV